MFNKIYEASLFDYKMNDEQLKSYNEKMNLGIADKCFFMHHLSDYQVLVDYGCADGNLIKAAMTFNPDAFYIGYDISDQMLSAAQNNIGQHDNLMLTSDFNKVITTIKKIGGTSIITLNSLIHEIYSYCNKAEQNSFWKDIFNSGFAYISIRDMMMREKAFNIKIPEDELEALKNDLIQLDHGEEKLASFEEINGEITTEGELIHLLMKWDYWNNWKREVNENYLGVKVEDFFRKLHTAGKGKYKVDYWEPFTLRYLKDKVKDLIGFDIKSSTHIKVLLKVIK